MQNIKRRDFIIRATSWSALASLGMPLTAHAQKFPAGPVHIIVPYTPGGASDVLARLTGKELQQSLGATFVVENKAGGGSQIGTKAVASATPDGQTLGFIDTAFVINPGLFGEKLPYDTRQDFSPVSLVATTTLVLLVHNSVPATTMKELVALAKAQPGKLNYGSAGVGSAPHLAGEQLRIAANIDINHVPYRGGSAVVTDLLAGHIQLGFNTVPTMLEHIRAGTVRALAVTGARTSQLPDVPTMAEAGLPAVDATPIFGLIAPRHTPKSTIDALAGSVAAAIHSGPLRQQLIDMGYMLVGSTADEFKARVDGEIKKWSAIIKTSNIKPNA